MLNNERDLYEIIVKFIQSETEVFNPSYTPDFQSGSTKNTNGDVGTRIRPSEHTTYTTNPIDLPTQRPPQQKIAIYTCTDYRVENGVLVITEKTGSLEGFLIPLSVIQEVKIARTTLKKDPKTDFNFTERLKG